NIGDLDRFTQSNSTAIGLFGARNHTKQCGFTRTVTADNPDYGTLGNAQRQVINQQAITVTFADILQLDHLIAQTLAWWNINFIRFVTRLEFVRLQFIQAGQTSLALGLAT